MKPRHRRPWIGAAVVIASALTLSACGGGDDVSTDPGDDTSTAATDAAEVSGPLEVWVRAANDSLVSYEMLFEKFTEETGVEIEVFATLTDFETKLSAAAAARDLPDIVINDASQLGNLQSQGIIRSFDQSSIEGGDDLSDAAWSSVESIDGQTYGVPFSAQANLLFVRTDWLDNLGLQAPTTWDEFVNVAKAFTTQDPDGDGQANTYGVAIPGSTQRGYISWNWSTYLWQAGGEYVEIDGDTVTPVIDSDEAIEAATWFQNLFCTENVVQPGALNATTLETNEAFQTGVVGMYLTGPYNIPTSDGTAVGGHYTVVAPPKAPNGGTSTMAEGTTIYFMVDSEVEAAADAFAEFMITPEAQEIGMVGNPKASIVRLPVNTTVDSTTVRDGDERWGIAQEVYESDGHYEPIAVPQWQEMRQAASDTFNKTISSCGDMSAALAELNQQYEQILS